jgi:glycine cleavage system H protein
MKFPQDLKYTKNDEWLRTDSGKTTATIGLTDYAQDQLSDIVYVEYSAAPGKQVAQGAGFATVESVKAAAEVYMPVDGEVSEVNKDLQAKPETVNSDPYGAGWLAKIKLTNPAQVDALMDAAAYEKYCQERAA